MEKTKIETFINKYSLGGAIEDVVWANDGNDNLSVTAMTNDRKLFASVQLEKAAFFKGVEVPIQETSKLKRMLGPLSENVALSLDIDPNDATRVREIIGEDGKVTVEFAASHKDAVDPVPKMKSVPQFTVEIVLSPEFIDTFTKSYSAINDKDTLFTLIMSKKKQKLELVLGYKQHLSDRIAMELTTNQGKDSVKAPISFSAKHLKEILSANSEVENTVLSVSEAGLASIGFEKDGFKSQYYLVKIDVED